VRQQFAVLRESAALSLSAKGQVFLLQDHHDGEVVVDRRAVDVLGRDAGLGKGQAARHLGIGAREIDQAAVVDVDSLAAAAQAHPQPLRAPLRTAGLRSLVATAWPAGQSHWC
jgi:hypothetical protein